jgi:hypothetical protein
MGDIVNLRTIRKRAKRSREDLDAQQNGLGHGRPQAARRLDEARADKARNDLDQHRIDIGDGR